MQSENFENILYCINIITNMNMREPNALFLLLICLSAVYIICFDEALIFVL